MCALVLALRKIPINAPGGAAAALGSVDQPSYTVAISDPQAATNRDAYKKSQDEKRLFPAEKSDATPEQSKDEPTKAVTSGIDDHNPRDSATSPPLRYRQPPASESTALSTLNSRHPAADTAHNPNDLIEPSTPKSLTHPISGVETSPDFDRSVSIEEVRGMLRRQSTRGKRRPSTGSTKFQPVSSDNMNRLPPPPATPSMQIDYDPWAYSEQQSTGSSPHTASFPQPPTSIPQKGPTSHPHPSPEMSQLRNQQRSPPLHPQQPRQAPPIAQAPTSAPSLYPFAPPKPFLSTDNLPPPNDTNRTSSPVRNPFQIKALGSQAQGVGVPAAVQTRRPVPGSANSYSPHGESAVRPPRGDSLPTAPP